MVGLPAGAAAHAFRHHYGVTPALRGVPGSVISRLMGHADLRPTSIYTTVASTQLIAALDDAGLAAAASARCEPLWRQRR